MRPETIFMLCNPYNGEPLELASRPTPGGGEVEVLVGVASGQVFPIRSGIPSILDLSHTPRRNRLWRWLYDRLSFAYDFTIDLGHRLRVGTEELIRRDYISGLPVKSGGKVLETAVGTAANFKFLPSSARFYGLDISMRMLLRAQRNLDRWGRQAELFHADAERLPFHAEEFDLVLNMGGLQFVHDPFKCVREMARVARPGAKVIVIDEASAALRTLRRMPAHARYATGKLAAVEAMERLAPHGVANPTAQMLPSGEFYALTFEKPS